MGRKLSIGRLKIMMKKIPGGFPIPLSWTEGSCIETSLTVLSNERINGADTEPLDVTEPGGLSSVIPLSYLSTATGPAFNNFLLGNHTAGTDVWPNPCTGSNKVLVHFTGSAAHVSASLPGGNTHIVMLEGARVELTWVPEGTESYGSWTGFWGSSLMHSGCYADCGVAPKAYLTESV